jgi:hypothetical protein
MAPLILNLSTKRKLRDQLYAPALLHLGNNPPLTNEQEAWWAAQLVWDDLEKKISYCARRETLDWSACSLVIILNSLSWVLKTSML